MANYDATSGFSELDGTIVIADNEVVSYTSNTLGSGTVQNLGGPILQFNVRFGSSRTYHINATANASGTVYTGTADDGGSQQTAKVLGQETWTATASTRAVDGSAEETANVSGDDAAAKTAAS